MKRGKIITHLPRYLHGNDGLARLRPIARTRVFVSLEQCLKLSYKIDDHGVDAVVIPTAGGIALLMILLSVC